MLTDEQLRVSSAELKISGLEATTKDYVLDWLLKGIYGDKLLSKMLLFKGGTALRKLYFDSNYRMSEDLDFTFVESNKIEKKYLNKSLFEEMLTRLSRESDLKFKLEQFNFLHGDKAEDADSIDVKVNARFPNGTGANINIDISLNETIITPMNTSHYIPKYPDLQTIIEIKAYSGMEIFCEKIRSLAQRNKVRDLYDVWHILNKPDVVFLNSPLLDLNEVLKRKFHARAVIISLDEIFDEDKTKSMQVHWETLKRLLMTGEELPSYIDVMEKIQDFLFCESRVGIAKSGNINAFIDLVRHEGKFEFIDRAVVIMTLEHLRARDSLSINRGLDFTDKLVSYRSKMAKLFIDKFDEALNTLMQDKDKNIVKRAQGAKEALGKL